MSIFNIYDKDSIRNVWSYPHRFSARISSFFNSLVGCVYSNPDYPAHLGLVDYLFLTIPFWLCRLPFMLADKVAKSSAFGELAILVLTSFIWVPAQLLRYAVAAAITLLATPFVLVATPIIARRVFNNQALRNDAFLQACRAKNNSLAFKLIEAGIDQEILEDGLSQLPVDRYLPSNNSLDVGLIKKYIDKNQDINWNLIKEYMKKMLDFPKKYQHHIQLNHFKGAFIDILYQFVMKKKDPDILHSLIKKDRNGRDFLRTVFVYYSRTLEEDSAQKLFSLIEKVMVSGGAIDFLSGITKNTESPAQKKLLTDLMHYALKKENHAFAIFLILHSDIDFLSDQFPNDNSHPIKKLIHHLKENPQDVYVLKEEYDKEVSNIASSSSMEKIFKRLNDSEKKGTETWMRAALLMKRKAKNEAINCPEKETCPQVILPKPIIHLIAQYSVINKINQLDSFDDVKVGDWSEKIMTKK